MNILEGLYHIFFKYAVDNVIVRVKLTLGKLYFFLKDFNILTEAVGKERVSLMFTKRCPNKLMDFAGFVDVLYKICKHSEPNSSALKEKDK